MSTTLVTGYKGFIGSNLYNTLSTQDRVLHGFDQEIFDKENWQTWLQESLDQIKPTTIFHVGACSDTLEQDVQYIFERNFQATLVLLKWTLVNNCKFIFSSSAASYGTNGSYPANLYAWSKFAAEQIVIGYGGVALRYFNVYGPGENNKGNMASFFYQSWLKLQNKVTDKVTLFPGFPTRDFVYIKDVVKANLIAEKSFECCKGNYYDVGTGVSRKFEDGLKLMGIEFDYTGEEVIPKGYQYFTKANPAKFIPGWSPEFSLERGLMEYSNSLKQLNRY